MTENPNGGTGIGGRGWTSFAGAATGYGLGLVALPIAALPAGAGARDVVIVVVAVVLASAVASAFARWAATGWSLWLGPLLVAVAALLYSVTPAGVSTAVIAVLLGAAAGLSTGARPWPGRPVTHIAGAVLAVAVVVATWLVGGSGSTLPFAVAAVTSVLAALTRWLAGSRDMSGVRVGSDRVGDSRSPVALHRSMTGVAIGAAVVLLAWTGCNDPRLSWFGPVASHGPRDRSRVALTFDDGPNTAASVEVARILDEHGAKGTFFVVGKAAVRRPEVLRRLVEDGHLVGNHSFHHDYYGWLNPLYPELAATQRVIGREAGVCPRFFRPPHGQRTPMMNLQVARRDMVAVTWDVSAGDWATGDGRLVAHRILDRVRPGSIILLHDGLDGHVDADRHVVTEALPIILDGLQRKGLEPVRVDELLGGPAYLKESDCN